MDGLETPVQALLIGTQHGGDLADFQTKLVPHPDEQLVVRGKRAHGLLQVAAHHTPVPFTSLVEERRERVGGRRAVVRGEVEVDQTALAVPPGAQLSDLWRQAGRERTESSGSGTNGFSGGWS